MTPEPIDEILAWSRKLRRWRRDTLRRLAICDELTEGDLDELLAMVKQAAGFELPAQAPKPEPFTKAHFVGGKQQPVVLKGIGGVRNVNRLVTDAKLDICPKNLTVIYGRNGSGKSGFVRILRTACRTRIDDPAKLRVLADVYGSSTGPQSADIIIDGSEGEKTIKWEAGMAAHPELSPIAVFDTLSAQIYVDGGNQIRYLPFGLDLPHRLNNVLLELKKRLDAERSSAVGNKVSLTKVEFPTERESSAQKFASTLSHATTDDQIAEATSFPTEYQERLDQVSSILSSGAAALADLAALINWLEAIAGECEAAAGALSDEALAGFTTLHENAVSTRTAAKLSASDLFTDEPLPGVGSDSWRVLWNAARDYSLTEAYVGMEFPVTSNEIDTAACVLCQQPLRPDGTERMQRFQEYMDDTLDVAARQAERALSDATDALMVLKQLGADDFDGRLEQIRQRDKALADNLSGFRQSAIQRRKDATARLAGEASTPVPALASQHAKIKELAAKLGKEKDALTEASETEKREKLENEKAELEDRKILAANQARLIERRDLMVTDAAYRKALSEVATTGTTKRANELVDKHLTSAVQARFDNERERFDIMHLKVGLKHKSGKTQAKYDIDPQTTMTRLTSQVLSEGEQRALALAGFLTEVALTDGSGPIIIDDPVSSLDRDRSKRVAERLAEEASQRQVVVFTHDLIFFNELCGAAEDKGIEPATIALFGDGNAAGKTDPGGITWKGLKVSKRIGKIKNDFAPLPKLRQTSPSDYDYAVKNLYGRLRDTYERVVEEVIFRDIVRRGSDVIRTQELRYITLSDDLAIRFHAGMTHANTHSHDNPASETVATPEPDKFLQDIADLEDLVGDIRSASDAAAAARPQMKPKN